MILPDSQWNAVFRSMAGIVQVICWMLCTLTEAVAT